jgi:hypothetical protein
VQISRFRQSKWLSRSCLWRTHAGIWLKFGHLAFLVDARWPIWEDGEMKERVTAPADTVMEAIEAVTHVPALRYFRSLREQKIVPAGKRGRGGRHPDIGPKETALVLLGVLSGESTRRAAASIDKLARLTQLERIGKQMYGNAEAVRGMAEQVVPEGRSGAAMAGILDRLARKLPGMKPLQLVAFQRAGDARCFLVRVQEGSDAGDVQFGHLPKDADDNLVTHRAIGVRGLQHIADTLNSDVEA